MCESQCQRSYGDIESPADVIESFEYAIQHLPLSQDIIR